MDNLNEFKKDIIKTEKIVKENQKELKQKIDNGWLSDVDETLENPENSNYYQKAIIDLSNVNKTSKKTFWKRIKENLINLLKQE